MSDTEDLTVKRAKEYLLSNGDSIRGGAWAAAVKDKSGGDIDIMLRRARKSFLSAAAHLMKDQIESNKRHLEDLAKTWEHTSKCKFKCADQEKDPFNKRFIEHGAINIINCFQSLRGFIMDQKDEGESRR